jgi:hypothetical protein
MYVPLPLALGSGPLDSLAQVAVLGGTLLLLLMIVALGTYAYKHFQGDGITWPEDMEDDPRETDDGLKQGNDDDEWKYY